MTSIVLHGYYGNQNWGDDAMLFATTALFGKQFPDVELRVLGQPPAVMNSVFGRIVSRLPYGRTLIYKPHLWKMKRNVDKANGLILGSGGFLYDDASRNVTRDLLLTVHAQKNGKPTMIYSVGVGGLLYERSKLMVRRVVDNAQYVSCRDPASAERIKEIGVEASVYVTADPAIVLPELLGFRPQGRTLGQRLRICVSLRNRFATPQLIESLARLLRTLDDRHDLEINLVPLRAAWFDDDRIPLEDLLARLDGTRILLHERPSVGQLIRIMDSTDITIGMKLHSVVSAVSMGVPTLALCYKNDVRDFMSYIEEEEYALSLTQACDFKCILGRIERLINTYNSTSTRLLRRVEAIGTKIALDVKGMKSLLEQCN